MKGGIDRKLVSDGKDEASGGCTFYCCTIWEKVACWFASMDVKKCVGIPKDNISSLARPH